jgi:osmotically-inducible protein OsmY
MLAIPNRVAIMRSDWAIRFDVCDRLVQHEALDSSGVFVSVRDGRVLLVGRVASRSDHQLTLQIASAVPGVRWVDDRLEDGDPLSTQRLGG